MSRPTITIQVDPQFANTFVLAMNAVIAHQPINREGTKALIIGAELFENGLNKFIKEQEAAQQAPPQTPPPLKEYPNG